MGKPYNKEQVIAWYKSLAATLMEAGIDVNKPADLARVKVFSFKEVPDTAQPGNPDLFESEKMYAFIPKTLGEAGDMEGYQVQRPHFPDAAAQTHLEELLNDNRDANNAYLDAYDSLTQAYKGFDDAKVEEEEKKFAAAEKKVHDTFGAFVDEGNKAFGDYYKWAYSQQKNFDPEKDYDQIEELYHCAMEGRLYINPVDENPENRWQIVVTGAADACAFSKTGAQEGAASIDCNVLRSAIDTVKRGAKPVKAMENICAVVQKRLKEFEEKNGLIGDAESAVNKRVGKRPEEVRKPGFASWMKRIFSFGFANGDFEKYSKYKTDLAAYNSSVEEARADNSKLYDQILKFANAYHKELGIAGIEGVLNPGTVENNRGRMHTAEFAPAVEDPAKEIYCDGTPMVMMRHAHMLEKEFSEHPGNINEDGGINLEKSAAYWKEKGEYVLPVTAGDRAKKIEKLNAAREKYLALDETERQKHVMLENLKPELADLGTLLKGKTPEETRTAAKKWTEKSIEERVDCIGELFGAQGSNATKLGFEMIKVCATRNQEYHADGSDRDYSKLRSDIEVISDLDELFDLADHPETKDEHAQLISDLKYMAAKSKGIPNAMFCDSVAGALASQELNDPDNSKRPGAGMFVCSCLANACFASESNPNGVNIEEGYQVPGGKSLPRSDAADRKRMSALGEACGRLNRSVLEYRKAQELKKAVKTNGQVSADSGQQPKLQQNQGLARNS